MTGSVGEGMVVLGLCRDRNEGANLRASSSVMKNECILIYFDILYKNIRLRSKRNKPSRGAKGTN
jgi:hypothetical protein